VDAPPLSCFFLQPAVLQADFDLVFLQSILHALILLYCCLISDCFELHRLVYFLSVSSSSGIRSNWLATNFPKFPICLLSRSIPSSVGPGMPK